MSAFSVKAKNKCRVRLAGLVQKVCHAFYPFIPIDRALAFGLVHFPCCPLRLAVGCGGLRPRDYSGPTLYSTIIGARVAF